MYPLDGPCPRNTVGRPFLRRAPAFLRQEPATPRTGLQASKRSRAIQDTEAKRLRGRSILREWALPCTVPQPWEQHRRRWQRCLQRPRMVHTGHGSVAANPPPSRAARAPTAPGTAGRRGLQPARGRNTWHTQRERHRQEVTPGGRRPSPRTRPPLGRFLVECIDLLGRHGETRPVHTDQADPGR